MEWEFYIAQKLSMTVADMRERMSNQEFVYWRTYYLRIAQQQQLRARKG